MSNFAVEFLSYGHFVINAKQKIPLRSAAQRAVKIAGEAICTKIKEESTVETTETDNFIYITTEH